MTWFRGWVDTMATFIIIVCLSGILGIALFMAGYEGAGMAVSMLGTNIGGLIGLWIDWRRFQRRSA